MKEFLSVYLIIFFLALFLVPKRVINHFSLFISNKLNYMK